MRAHTRDGVDTTTPPPQHLCNEVETVRDFTYLCDRVSGGCESTVTATARCAWCMPRECCELLHRKSFHLKQKIAVYKSNPRPVILHGNE